MAAYSSNADCTVTIDGEGFTMSGVTDEYNNVAKMLLDGDDLPVAKVGELTTRTDNETGTLTMETGHGITTGARLDLYWAASTDPVAVQGSRRGILVGTVSGNSVPIGADNSGSGDNLPLVNVAITAMVPHVETFNAAMDDALAYAMSIAGLDDAARCTISFGFFDTAYVEGGAIVLGGNDYGTVAAWADKNMGTNPLTAAGDVNRVYVSHGDSVNAATAFKLSVGLP